MRALLPAALTMVAATAMAQEPEEPTAVVAWFTDAEVEGASAAGGELPECKGTSGRGVRLDSAVPVEHPLLQRENGLISFWVKPAWDGDDGRRHQLLRIGDPGRNGLLIEKSERNMLRYVMASPENVTAARADVSHWQAGEWRQVTVVWRSNEDGPVGTTLFLDEHLPGRGGPVTVHGPVASGNTFLAPEAMDDPRVWIGDETAEAEMDELIMRAELGTELSRGLIDLVHRDYFRTAPYTDIAIDPEPNRVRCDRRVVAGHEKQFGLKAKVRDQWRPVTDFTVRYGQWGYFDAKPFIMWETSDRAIATVDETGLATGAQPGTCKLTAQFRGLKASFPLEVTPVEQPDLSVAWVSRLPKYEEGAAKDTPEPGDAVRSVARVMNYGYRAVPEGVTVRFELVPDANRNFVLDEEATADHVQQKTLDARLGSRDEVDVTFDWSWPEEPTFVRVTADPEGRLAELCEANNERHHLNIARPARLGMTEGLARKYHRERSINLVGSFSYFDYAQATGERFEQLMREAVYPTTSAVGIQDSIYIDKLYEHDQDVWQESPFHTERAYFDGGYPNVEEHIMNSNSGLLHEYGHTIISLPDMYNYPVAEHSVLLRDEAGEPYVGGPYMPVIGGGDIVGHPLQPAACGPYYSSLMDFCHMWIHPVQAGFVHRFRGYRGQRFWGTQGRLMPTEGSVLLLTDVDDEPLANAAVYVYHVTHFGDRQVFCDRPKFVGHTDADGRYELPRHTDDQWDDARTDEVDGAISVWTPFGRVADNARMRDVPFTSNVIETEGMLLVKVVSNGETEFHWLADTHFQEAYLGWQTVKAKIPLATCLHSAEEPEDILRPEIPEAIREANLVPVARIEPGELTVGCGEEFTVDASASSDPEGLPLVYLWRGAKAEPDNPAVARAKAPDQPREMEVRLIVCDGIRGSEEVRVTVKVVE